MSVNFDIRNRIVEHRKMRLGDIADNPNNWRMHPQMQKDALNGLVKEVGWVGTPIVYKSDATGKWTYADGHLRKHAFPNLEVEVAITDLNDAEANLLIATYDPIGDLATADKEIYAAVIRDIHTTDAALSQMISNLAETQGLIPKDIAPPDSFQEYDENIDTEHQCPKCGYKWSGGK